MIPPVIHCKYDTLIPASGLTPHPKNRNQHSHQQIERLAKLLSYQGVRAPVVVSTLTKYIVKGHGTLAAMQLNGWDEIPVVFQDFADESQEYAFVQSDNAIAAWSEMDLSGINSDLAELHLDDIELLGFEDFKVDLSENEEAGGDAAPAAPATPRHQSW